MKDSFIDILTAVTVLVLAMLAFVIVCTNRLVDFCL